MLVKIKDMISVVDSYKLQEITDNNDEITTTCLRAAEARVLSYLSARYDIDEIMKIPATSPILADICEIIKDIALYNVLRRHNVDLAYDRVCEAYKLHNEYLAAVATGKINIPGLPMKRGEDGAVLSHLVIGSKPKSDFAY